MKLLFCLLAGALSLGLSAQKPFEGTIRYKIFLSPKPDTVDLSITFGRNKTRLQIDNKKNEYSLVQLTDLDSGVAHTLEIGSKTYHTRQLAIRQPRFRLPAPGNRTIAGRAATGVDLGKSWPEYLPLMTLAEAAVVYTANDLFFPVPEKYAHNLELIFVHNGRIVLGGEVVIIESYKDSGPRMEEDSLLKPRILFEAQEIKAGPVDPALLGIPADFTAMDNFMADTVNMLDTAALITDTMMVEEELDMTEEIPPPPPPRKKETVKEQPIKKPASKGKVPGNKKQAARKPE